LLMRLSGYSESLPSVLRVTYCGVAALNSLGEAETTEAALSNLRNQNSAPVELTPHDRGFFFWHAEGTLV
jgi:hypothetical protein